MIIFHSQSEHEFCKSFIPLRAKRAAFAGHVCPDFFQLQPSFSNFSTGETVIPNKTYL